MTDLRRLWIAGALVGALGLLGLGIPAVLAHSAKQVRTVAGSIEAIDGSGAAHCASPGAAGTVVVVWAGRERHFAVTSATRFSGADATNSGGLCVGDWASARLTASGAGVTATAVQLSVPRVTGTVASVNGATTAGTCGATGGGGSFTIRAGHGAIWTVVVGGRTSFSAGSSRPASFADACVGGRLSAAGPVSGRSLAATSVTVTAAGSGVDPAMPPALAPAPTGHGPILDQPVIAARS